jgi:glutamate synthase domain-containing protein 2
VKSGQGAQSDIGGHLPGEKVVEDISKMRMIPKGMEALSPAHLIQRI